MKTSLTADQARGAITTGHVRYILALSLAGAVIGLLVVALTS